VTLRGKLAELQRELERKSTEMRMEHESNIQQMTLQQQTVIERIEAGRYLFYSKNKKFYLHF